jgi:DNA-binding NtrC family response regulator
MMDVWMPGQDGMSLLEEWMSAGFSMPVVMMSGHAGHQDVVKAKILRLENTSNSFKWQVKINAVNFLCILINLFRQKFAYQRQEDTENEITIVDKDATNLADIARHLDVKTI